MPKRWIKPGTWVQVRQIDIDPDGRWTKRRNRDRVPGLVWEIADLEGQGLDVALFVSREAAVAEMGRYRLRVVSDDEGIKAA